MSQYVNSNNIIGLSTVSLHQANSVLSLHGVGMELPSISKDGDVPAWIHLLPAGEIKTVDGRGPYQVKNIDELMNNSMAGGRKLVIDINHATDHLAKKGQEAPAYGWIVALENRVDGVWGKVEWNEAGAEKLGRHEYRYISPAIQRDEDFNISSIQRASLVNTPNLLGLTELNSESEMNFTEKLIKKLGLKDGANEGAILAALDGLNKSTTELQAALDPIAVVAGLKAGATQTELMSAVVDLAKTKTATPTGVDQSQLITDLQSTVTDQGALIADLQGDSKRKTAEAYVDASILAGRVGVKNQRQTFIDLHVADAVGTEKLISGLPELASGGSHTTLKAPPLKEGDVIVPPETAKIAEMMGVDNAAIAKTLAADAKSQEAL